jgi:DNA repair protein RecN (Recombination protein N)
MLAELRVRDLAVIADVTLPLAPGLNVLTGETGAGKSLLVDALALLLGERASGDVVRPGAERAVVEGAVELSAAAGARLRPALAALGIEGDDGTLVIKREVLPEGRSRAWVNGSPTAIGVLARLGALLVDLHGQHETQSLLRADVQRDLLDAYADAALERAAVRDAHARLAEVVHRAAELTARQDEVRRKADYLRHVVDEITKAAPRVGEEEELEAQARRLAHAEEIGRLCRELEQAAATTSLARAPRLLSTLGRLAPEAGRWQELVDAAFANLEELAGEARALAAGLEADPARLAGIEERRDALHRLRQKYGPTLPDVLATRDRASRELDLLDTAELDQRDLAEQRAAAERDLTRACAALSAKRAAGAARLGAAVTELLPALGMTDGTFGVERAPLPAPRADGAEAVGFWVRLNVGLEARPLARAASGGELSRLMLALKVVLAEHDAVPTLVFDEVDQGIGGEVGGRVGDALARVARGGDERQVLVITHLPQIAARADRHLVVAKSAHGGLTTSDVRVVAGEERRREVARMLGDPDMATALRHAAELLRTASAAPATPAGSSRPPGRGRSRP